MLKFLGKFDDVELFGEFGLIDMYLIEAFTLYEYGQEIIDDPEMLDHIYTVSYGLVKNSEVPWFVPNGTLYY